MDFLGEQQVKYDNFVWGIFYQNLELHRCSFCYDTAANSGLQVHITIIYPII